MKMIRQISLNGYPLDITLDNSCNILWVLVLDGKHRNMTGHRIIPTDGDNLEVCWLVC